MYYFTDEKYQNGTAFKEYEEACKLNWNKFPPDFKTIHKSMLADSFYDNLKYCLHDCRIMKLTVEENYVKVSIAMYSEIEQKPYTIILNYQGAKITKQVSNCIVDGSEDSDSDIMCHEAEVLNNNMFKHTYLFSCDEELEIVFKDFSLMEIL